MDLIQEKIKVDINKNTNNQFREGGHLISLESGYTVKAPGVLFNFRPQEGGLIKEGGLIERVLISNHKFSRKFSLILETLLLHH